MNTQLITNQIKQISNEQLKRSWLIRDKYSIEIRNLIEQEIERREIDINAVEITSEDDQQAKPMKPNQNSSNWLGLLAEFLQES